MAKRLTEEMVIARTKISDLSKVKRLNCWGSELEDVSLLRSMPSVEVLSLSINKITKLEDFQLCTRLEELYIRQNDIRDLNQVMYLQNLTSLKNLWLGENPCASADGYRLAVIRALPQLQKLDNIAVAQEELREAQRRGKILTNPGAPQESEEEEYIPPQQFNRYEEYTESEYSPPPRISPQRSSPPQETEYELYESGVEYHRDEASEESRDFSPPRQVSPPRHREPINRGYSPEAEVIERRKSTYERESPKQQYYEKSPSASNSFEEPTPCIENFYKEGPKMVTSQSANCIKEYTNGNDRYHGNNYRTSENGEHANQNQARDRHVCGGSHRPPFNRRPVTRNSNILSAVLCLVKELDYPSLEVVEMAVRCRMDELDE